MYDVDNDNVLSKEELRNLIGGVGKRMSAQELDRFIEDTMVSQSFIEMTVKKSLGENKSASRAFTRIVSTFIRTGKGKVSPQQTNNEKETPVLSIEKKKFAGFDFREFKVFVDRLRSYGYNILNESNEDDLSKEFEMLGKKEEVEDEEKTEEKIKNPVQSILDSKFIIHQDSSMKQLWDIFVCIFLIFVLIETPFRIGFDSSPDDTFSAIEYFIDAFFIADLGLQFFVTYTDSMGQEENRVRCIALQYIRTRFFIDLLSSFPFNWFLTTSDTLGSAFRFVKLLKLGRIARINRIVANVRESSDMKTEEEQLILVLIMLVILSHCMACIWAFSGRYGSCEECLMMESWQSRLLLFLG